MTPISSCAACGRPLYEDDDHFDPERLVRLCRTCVEDREASLREEFGRIGVLEAPASTCEHGS